MKHLTALFSLAKPVCDASAPTRGRLAVAACACLAALLSVAPAGAEAQRLHWLSQSGILTLMDGDEIVWALRHGKDNAKPFFYPIKAPDGTELARYRPESEEHPWHRGLWFSFKYINGVNYWEEDRATLVSEGVTEIVETQIEPAADHSAEIRMKIVYHEKGGPPLVTEAREIHVSTPTADGSYFFDWSGVFTAHEDLSLGRTPIVGQPDGKPWGGYAGLSLRFPHELSEQWRFSTSGADEGQGRRPHGSANRWAYYGGDTTGVALFDMPENAPGKQTSWYLDTDMPFMSPAFLFESGREVKRGESWTLRYRIKVYCEPPERADLEADYERFVGEKIDLVATGRRLFRENNCMECHATAPDDPSFKTGPNLYGLAQAPAREHGVATPDGKRITLKADGRYIARSLLDPAALLSIRETGPEKGAPYPAAMPPYPWIDEQGLEAITAYLKTLNPEGKRGPQEVWQVAKSKDGQDELTDEIWVGSHAVIARTLLPDSSTRSIHVGLPNHANYTFDTVSFSLARIWWGGFIDASAEREQRADPGIGSLPETAVPWPGAKPLLVPLAANERPVDLSFKSWPVFETTDQFDAHYEAQRKIDAQTPYLEQVAAVDARFLGIERRDPAAPSLRFRIGNASYTQTTRVSDSGQVVVDFETTGTSEPLRFALDEASISGATPSAGDIDGGIWRVPASEAKAFSIAIAPKNAPAKPSLPRRVETGDRQALVWTPDENPTLPRGYRSESAALPTDRFGRPQLFEPLGIAFAANGTAVVASRTAGIWKIENDQWRFFADGFYDPLGVWIEDERGDSVVVGHKPELTRLSDTDGDGYADRFETIDDTWRLAGNYCEYVHGPVRDEAGNYFFNLNLAVAGFTGGGKWMGSLGGYDGWTARVAPGGPFEPWASGLRSPAGIGWGPEGRLLYTENQGSFVGTSKLFAVERGAYYGYPASLVDHPQYRGKELDVAEINKGSALPLVYLPHGLVANSPGSPLVESSSGKFGPFAGQILIGDQTLSNITRVTLEEVDGVWQGAAMPFLSGFDSGAMRLALSPEGHLWIGQTGRGWASKGGKLDALQRVVWDGTRQPFEIHDVTLGVDGFHVSFTDTIRTESLEKERFQIRSWYYEDTEEYGSPRHGLQAHEVTRLEADSSGKAVFVKVSGLIPGRIYGIEAGGVVSQKGLRPSQGSAYYTAHRLPR